MLRVALLKRNIYLRFAAFFIAVIFLGGCFHYTPSRREMAESGDTSIAGPEAFRAYHDQLRGRLDALLADRAALLEARSEESYRIGRGDVLKIDVFGFSELSGEVTVSEDGTVGLPLVGAVTALDRTIALLQAELKERYAKFVRNPNVRLSLNSYNAHRVSVVGAVVKTGSYPIKHGVYTLTELLAEAGGVKDNSANRIFLIPAAMPSTHDSAAGTGAINKAGVEIDIDELVGTLDKPPLQVPLVAGDVVVVPEAGQFRVGGEVERPGSFAVSKRASALGAIAAAGGFTYAANVNEVEVIREVGSGKKASVTVDLEKVAFNGAPDVMLKDGDVVIVPSAPGRFRARQVVEAFRSVFRGGVTGSVRYQ